MNLIPIVHDNIPGDILSNALSYRIVYLVGEINSSTALLVNAQLQYLAMQSDKEDIHLYINSPGGSVSDGLSIIDTMRSIPCDVSVVVCGLAASMGAIIASAGTPGKRKILPNSSMMIHQVRINHLEGKETDVRVLADWISKQKELLNQMLAENTGQPLEKIAQDTLHDYYLLAREAKEYGLVDVVIGSK